MWAVGREYGFDVCLFWGLGRLGCCRWRGWRRQGRAVKRSGTRCVDHVLAVSKEQATICARRILLSIGRQQGHALSQIMALSACIDTACLSLSSVKRSQLRLDQAALCSATKYAAKQEASFLANECDGYGDCGCVFSRDGERSGTK